MEYIPIIFVHNCHDTILFISRRILLLFRNLWDIIINLIVIHLLLRLHLWNHLFLRQTLSFVLTLSNYRPPCYHYLHVTHYPGLQSASRHSFNIGQLAIYWEIVFWRWRTYVYTSSRTSVNIASTRGGYSCCPYFVLCCWISCHPAVHTVV